MTGAALGDRFGRLRLFVAGVGGLRACAECWLADRRARSAGVRVGTGDAAGADAVERGIPS